jgi:phytoene desaturase
MADVCVIGAGVGGLVSALRLARAGHNVTVLEKNDRVGGKLAAREMDGFHFDTGPSLLTMPDEFTSLGLDIDLVRLAHPFRYSFADGSELKVHDDAALTETAFGRFAPGGDLAWKRMNAHGQRVWDIATRTFLAGPMYPVRSLVRRMQSPLDLVRIDGLRTLASRGESFFDDVRLRQWFNRYATYSGSSPWLVPATLSCIPYIEQQFGCWHIAGGLSHLAVALEKSLRAVGVDIVFGADVQRIEVDEGRSRVRGVRTRDSLLSADVVVANVDVDRLYSTLLDSPALVRRARRAGRSTSGFAMTLGLSGTTPGLAHHNVWFSADQRREFTQILGAGVADDPTIYVCCSSKTDPTQAPDGCENWFVLVNTGASARTDWRAYGDRIIDRLGVRDRVVVRADITPHDLAIRYGAPDGAIYGTSSNGRSSAFLRSSNRGPVTGMYHVGGSAHPGGGLPMVARSAAIVADLVERDGFR